MIVRYMQNEITINADCDIYETTDKTGQIECPVA
jgi:hypothetical protein